MNLNKACDNEISVNVCVLRHTTHRSQRLVSLAVRSVMLSGAMSGGACRVWIFLEGWLGGLVPTIFT